VSVHGSGYNFGLNGTILAVTRFSALADGGHRGGTLNKTRDYQRHAAECRKLAEIAATEGQKADLLKIAELWERLASERERLAPDADEPAK
jgi:hypothetical protein